MLQQQQQKKKPLAEIQTLLLSLQGELQSDKENHPQNKKKNQLYCIRILFFFFYSVPAAKATREPRQTNH